MFTTINGLKVRLDIKYAFNYLFDTHFYDIREKEIDLDETNFETDLISDKMKSNMFAWQTSIEAFSLFPSFASIVCLIFMMFSNFNAVNAGIAIIFVYLIVYLIQEFSIFFHVINFIFGNVYLFFYKYLTHFFGHYILIIVLTIITKSYWLLLSYVIARIICVVVTSLINIKRLKYNDRKYNLSDIGFLEIIAVRALIFYSGRVKTTDQFLKNYSEYINADQLT